MAKIQSSSNQLVALIPDPLPEDVAEIMVAFANADGGTLYIGVAEGGKPSGLIFPDDIGELLEQAEMLCTPPVHFSTDQIEYRGEFVFIVRVYRSSELHALDDGRILLRTGAENRPLTAAEVQQIAPTRTGGDHEIQPMPGAKRSDLDEEVLQEFIDVWQERQGRSLTIPVDDLLQEMGWLTAFGQPTLSGMLLFARNPESFLPRCGITFVKFDGSQVRRVDGDASYGKRLTINGPLARVINRMWDVLQTEIHLGAEVSGLKRKEQWMYPPQALREALVNAIVHRDYQIRGRGVEVRMFNDRLEISSPGGLPGYITLDNIVDEHLSRNPRIVNGLYQWGFIEELGLGIDLMIEEMVNAGHKPPEFRAQDHAFTVVFHRASSGRRSVQLPKSMDITMNERQAKVIAYLQQHQRIRNREYQELCPDVSPETLRLDLADLVERGILLKIGQKRGTYYILK